MTTYTYSIQNDITAQVFCANCLTKEINASLTGLQFINITGDNFDLIFNEVLSSSDKDTLDSIVLAHAGNPIAPITPIINNAKLFFNELSTKFAAENVLMGITQAGKTKDVIDFTEKLFIYGNTGSLYEVIAEIDYLLTQDMTGLSPFVTTARLNAFKAQVQGYLGI